MENRSLYLSSVSIAGFKAIDDLELKSLASINLLTGDNNVGKSTLLGKL